MQCFNNESEHFLLAFSLYMGILLTVSILPGKERKNNMSVFTPDLYLDNITQVDISLLKRHNIKGVILDVDNTLTLHNSQAVEQMVLDWLKEMKDQGIGLTIVSNNYEARVRPFAEKLGLDFVPFGCKPLTRGISIACKRLGLPKEQVAMIGDQIYTDIMGGNLKGVFTILVKPFQLEDSLLFRIKRRLEKIHIRKYHRRHGEEQR